MIVRATLALVPSKDLVVAPASGRLTHALAYELVRRGDEAVATWLHDERGRPVGAGLGRKPSVHTALLVTSGVVLDGPEGLPDFFRSRRVGAGTPLYARITALGLPVAAALMSGLAMRREVRLGATPCSITGVKTEARSLPDLWTAAARMPCNPTLDFLTLTAFTRRGALRLALPVPERVFARPTDGSGLARRWTDVASLEDGPADGPRIPEGWDPASVGACPVSLAGGSADFDRWKRVEGFTGRCTFSPPAGDRGARRTLWALSLFAEFAAVGMWAGFGLGQVRLAWDAHRSREGVPPAHGAFAPECASAHEPAERPMHTVAENLCKRDAPNQRNRH